jgi:hypothetical protein
VLGSNLGQDASYSDLRFIVGFFRQMLGQYLKQALLAPFHILFSLPSIHLTVYSGTIEGSIRCLCKNNSFSLTGGYESFGETYCLHHERSGLYTEAGCSMFSEVCCNPGDHKLNLHHCGNLKSYTVVELILKCNGEERQYHRGLCFRFVPRT